MSESLHLRLSVGEAKYLTPFITEADMGKNLWGETDALSSCFRHPFHSLKLQNSPFTWNK